MTEDSAFYDRALGRMDRIAISAAVLVIFLFLLKEGWPAALGCGVAAAASIYNLRRLRALADRLEKPGSAGSAVLAGLRFLLLGLLCFAIIRYFGVSAVAVFSGLLISVVAVLIEIFYELIFTR